MKFAAGKKILTDAQVFFVVFFVARTVSMLHKRLQMDKKIALLVIELNCLHILP